MNSFHETLLARYDYLPRDMGDEKSKVIEYHKSVMMGDMVVNSHIEIYYHDNPDNLAYRGVVTFLREDGKRIAEWDSERRYKMLDVVLGCERATTMVEAVLKHHRQEGK
jgi:hypothetical protein